MQRGWWSQPFPPDGGVASEGIQKQLGTPAMDPLAVFLRESSQNSWDARTEGSVSLTYEFCDLPTATLEPLTSPVHSSISEQITHLRAEASTPTILVSDRGTSGLGGPLRSGIPGGENDFVNFVRNVGQPRDTEHGGGTYGFGKGVFYRLSSAGTIIVDTQCVFEGKIQRRLIGSALGSSYEAGGQLYTGRHWWGALVDDLADPLIDANAGAAATELGLRGFTGAETGTDIYVIGAQLGVNQDGVERTIEQAADYLTSVALWYLWPKLCGTGEPAGLDLKVRANGADVEVPDPRSLERLGCFVEALDELRGGGGTPKKRARAPKVVGHFSASKSIYLAKSSPMLDLAQPFEGPPHHCALMRDVELVVDYVAGSVPDDPAIQYAAVFKATKDADEHFSRAEPPTHDAWVTSHLRGTDHGVVRDAKVFVNKELAEVLPPPVPKGSGSKTPLGQLSSSLARMLPGAEGDAATGTITENGGGSSRGANKPAFKLVGAPQVFVLKETAFLAQRVDISPEFAGTILAEAEIAVDGGRERRAPDGAAAPRVSRWLSAERDVSGAALRVEAGATTHWLILVVPVPNTATLISAKVVDGGEQ